MARWWGDNKLRSPDCLLLLLSNVSRVPGGSFLFCRESSSAHPHLAIEWSRYEPSGRLPTGAEVPSFRRLLLVDHTVSLAELPRCRLLPERRECPWVRVPSGLASRSPCLLLRKRRTWKLGTLRHHDLWVVLCFEFREEVVEVGILITTILRDDNRLPAR